MIIQVNVNGVNVLVKEGSSILDGCEKAGFYIPRFCFHSRLGIAGNCRICLVEVVKSPKPIVACSTPVSSGMSIFVDSPLVRKARESILEFMLINHPLDCPICDQGGECDLQNQAVFYGSDRSRFLFNKRAVFDKNWGSLVQTVITRCIQCTRCVRFLNGTVGFNGLGTSGRGVSTEIGFYFNKGQISFFSGNVVDLCPVGFINLNLLCCFLQLFFF